MKVNKVICYAGLVGLLLGSAKAAAQSPSPSPSPGPNDNQAYAAYAAWDTADFHSIQIYSTPPGNFTCPNNGTLLWYGWLVGKGTDVGTTSLADGTSNWPNICSRAAINANNSLSATRQSFYQDAAFHCDAAGTIPGRTISPDNCDDSCEIMPNWTGCGFAAGMKAYCCQNPSPSPTPSSTPSPSPNPSPSPTPSYTPYPSSSPYP